MQAASRVHRCPHWLLAAISLLLCTFQARADSGRHVLWSVQGHSNVVYLMGSIHVLRQSDYPLDPALLAAYASSQTLVMEIDLSELDSGDVQQQMLQAAMLADGRTLQDVLGSDQFRRASALSQEVGVPLETLQQFKPWFVAESITQLQLMQLGFDPSAGIEMYFLQRARTDGKTIQGLETAQDQIELFDSMPLDRQSRYLMASLGEAKTLPTQVDQMVRAWRRGDTAWFAAQMQKEFGDDPELYRSVLVARNRKWLPKIESFLKDRQNYLVIVGTGHLAGTDSVIEMLRRDGYAVAQQ